MSYSLYLSYSGRKYYLTCPRKYYYSYILKDRTRIGDVRGAFLGSILGKVFEWFYTRKAWATVDPVITTNSYVSEAMSDILTREGFDKIQDPAFYTMLCQDVNKYVPEGIEIIRKNGLLSPQSRAETDLTVEYTSPKHEMTIKIGGRSDFLHGHSDKDIWLMDGKASKHRDKYVDSEQLIWYANQHFIKYHIAPTRLGFIFWCFPEDPIKWIEYDNNMMRASLDKTFEVAKKILLKQFDPTPTKECHLCDYREKCEDGAKYLAKRKVEAGERIDIENSLFLLERV